MPWGSFFLRSSCSTELSGDAAAKMWGLGCGLSSRLPRMYCLPVDTPSTTYEEPLSLSCIMRTALSHFLLMWHCMSAKLPAGWVVYSFVLEFLLSVLALLRASLDSMNFDPFFVCLLSMGSLCLWMCPKKSWLGDSPSPLP